ncbi:hypothetical protein [uncultured Clostridium sp.]|uniref:hypothetical protein n=1 Tax=uncultured Clostridium sp. TaxID=59620 RepID=UPI0026240882|nr:hypothetical protein [uncultured Clostridium sp.]
MENILLFLLILFTVLIIRSIIKGIYYRKKIKNLIEEVEETKRENIHLKSIFSMTSYHVRSYKEGTNPYTTMSKIIDLYREEL